ncbi:hypothetical protein C8F04DRAFT_1189937 [Mycena alexandri]|uniref:Uncharacterized protein n=1 Tax=Mycena alexandri TaxID=1745969 RepID=A0AAD6WXL3_9AGAR|nr:hypothetical protein C8F04DRAFT_1189937 [Mycena alexandri]
MKVWLLVRVAGSVAKSGGREEEREDGGGGGVRNMKLCNSAYRALTKRLPPGASVPIGRSLLSSPLLPPPPSRHSPPDQHHNASPRNPGGDGGRHPGARRTQYPPQTDSHVNLHLWARLSCRACPTFMSVPRPPFSFSMFGKHATHLTTLRRIWARRLPICFSRGKLETFTLLLTPTLCLRARLASRQPALSPCAVFEPGVAADSFQRAPVVQAPTSCLRARLASRQPALSPCAAFESGVAD